MISRNHSIVTKNMGISVSVVGVVVCVVSTG